MTDAWMNPQVAVGVEVDMTECIRRREEAGNDAIRISTTHVVVRGVALTLREHPALNARLVDNVIETSDEINVGVAVAVEGGILVPSVDRADEKSLEQIAIESSNHAEAARAMRVSPAALRTATFTVSNLSAAGIDWFAPILNAPQAAILGVGATRDRAVVREGAIVIAPVCDLTLVFDHRAVDGYPASLFLEALRARLTNARDL
jgi:pyruvate dehydrogenase E2 component (dihydrolipoamide acetyltransferase)